MKNEFKLLTLRKIKPVKDAKERMKYGSFGSIIGMVTNISLFGFKFWVGTITGSMSIRADAFNNLSDTGTSVISFLSTNISAKPADKEHPYGHGRFEYVATLAVSFVILMIGFNLLQEAIQKILHPQALQFSLFALIVVVVSIFTKVWLSLFQKHVGVTLNAPAFVAVSKDSLSDVVVTTATLVSLVVSSFSSIPIDGYMGLIVSLFVLKSGFDVAADATKMIIGEKPDEELLEQLGFILLSHERILGYHDLVVHNYGPNRYLASVDVEVNAKESLVEIHDLIDQIEKMALKEANVMMTIHIDPIAIDDLATQEMLVLAVSIIESYDKTMAIHDFRIVTCHQTPYVSFDLDVSSEYKQSNRELKEMIQTYFKEQDFPYSIEVFIDRGYL